VVALTLTPRFCASLLKQAAEKCARVLLPSNRGLTKTAGEVHRHGSAGWCAVRCGSAGLSASSAVVFLFHPHRPQVSCLPKIRAPLFHAGASPDRGTAERTLEVIKQVENLLS